MLFVVVVLGVGALIYARFTDDGPSRTEVAERQESCDALQTFNSLLADPRISPPTPEAPVRPEAVTEAVTALGDLDSFAASSPTGVRADVRTLVAALRAQPPDVAAALRAPTFVEARKRLQGFLNDPKNVCTPPAGSGEG